jgi:hypothetical protein
MILTKFKHSKIQIYIYLIVMKTVSIFILLIYWSVMIFAPVMSKDVKISRTKLNKGQITSVSRAIG